MTQENKELLLKDLCARLPYGVIVETPKGRGHVGDINIALFGHEVGVNINPISRYKFNIEKCKPYLFPLSSMSREQVYRFYLRFVEDDISFGDFLSDYWNTNSLHRVSTSIDDCYDVICFFCENHIDFNNLIPKGLALDATELNIY